MAKNSKTPIVKDSSYKGKGALDAFLNLLTLISLSWMAWAAGRIYFSLIEKYFDQVNFFDSIYYQSQIKYAIASLLVITPIYFGVLNLLHKKYQKNELNHNSGIYKWLTYLMLLISSLAIIGSLITLIQKFLNGDYTVPFTLKVLTVIVIAIFVFGYYFYDLKRKDYNKYSPISLAVGLVVGLLIVLGLVVGFMSVDTPNKARLRSLDEKLEQSLNNVSFAVFGAYKDTAKLEESYNLKEMVATSYADLVDKNISYRRVSSEQFELCVNFNFESRLQMGETKDFDLPWLSHQSGRQCYIMDAKKQSEKYFKEINMPVEAYQSVPSR